MQTFPQIAEIRPSDDEHSDVGLNCPPSRGCDKYNGNYTAIVHRMFPTGLKK